MGRFVFGRSNTRGACLVGKDQRDELAQSIRGITNSGVPSFQPVYRRIEASHRARTLTIRSHGIYNVEDRRSGGIGRRAAFRAQ